MKHIEVVFKKIASISKKEKTPVYVVGGFVRDLLLGLEQKKDVDFVVVGSGLAFAKKFDEAMKEEGSLVEFPDFDTARYVFEAEEGAQPLVIEFAGARTEKYDEKSRKPKVEAATLEQDLGRRDFTVNAMAIEVGAFASLPFQGRAREGLPSSEHACVNDVGSRLRKGRQTPPNLPLERGGNEVVDPFNGQQDLKDKILRTPLDPDVTFSDDPLRMLRAVRFAAQLHFSIEPKTLEAIHRNRERMKIISGERVQEEIIKLMNTAQPSVGLQLMWTTGLMDVVLPEVSALDGVEEIFGHQHKNNLVHSFKVTDNVAEYSTNPWLRLAGLLHDIGKPGTKQFLPKIGWSFHAHEHLGKKLLYGIARRLKLSKEHTDYLAALIRWHLQPIALMDEGITDSAVRRLIVTMGDLLEDLLILGRSDITTGNPNKKEKRLKNYDKLKIVIAEVLERDKLRAFQSPVRGDEIMQLCQLKPGPTVGKIKEAIEEAILDGKIPNDYEAAKKYFEEIKDSYLKDAADWEKV